MKKSRFVNIVLFAFVGVLFTGNTVLAHDRVIRSASELDYPPFSIVTEDGQADGFSVELLRAALDAVKIDVDYYVGPWSEIKEDLKNGLIEVLPLVGRTPEREQVYDFTVPYITLYGNVFIREDEDGIKNLSDLKEKEVLVMKGDNAEEFAKREEVSDKLIATTDYDEAFRLLAEGKHDAIIAQGIVGKKMLEKLNIKNVIAVARIDKFKQDFTFAVQEGDSELLAQLNEGLSIIIANGVFDEIYDKWLVDALADIEEVLNSENSESLEVKIMLKQKAVEVAGQIEIFLVANQGLGLSEIQNDPFFKKIAIQTIGETGYTVVFDSKSGYFYFHPQDKLVNTDPYLLKDDLPEWYDILEKTTGANCTPSSGTYDWIEEDGNKTKKFMATACVKIPTADGIYLFVAATNYLDQEEGVKYLQQYQIKPGFSYSRDAINQRAFDISKQIELYLNANPQKTLDELREDVEFQKLAVQQVGDTGYTYLITHETGVLNFHPDPKIRDTSYNNFKERFPVIWSIINESVIARPCQDSNGFYEWADINGDVRDKYTYHHCIDAQTADGYSFFLGASTYLDEYRESEIDTKGLVALTEVQATPRYAILIFSLLVFAVMFIALLQFLGVVNIRGSSLYFILGSFFALASGMYIVSSYLTVEKLREAFLESYINQHYQLVELQSEKIVEQIENMGVELKFLADNESGIKKTDYDLKELLHNAYDRSEDYVYASYRISKEGIIENMYPLDKNSIGADISGQMHMAKIRETLKPVLSDVFDAVEGFQGVTLHYPVLVNGKYDGTVAFLVNIDDLLANLALFDKHIHPHESFLFDKNKKVILSDNKEYLGKTIFEIENYSVLDDDFEKIINSREKNNLIIFPGGDDEQIMIYSPVILEDNTWYLLINGVVKNVYLGTDSALNNIWFFTFLTLVSLLVLGVASGYFMTSSLRIEVEKQTVRVREKAKLIEEQLNREAAINEEKENLLNEQKVSKRELEEKVSELEKFQKLVVDREVKMIELKKKIAQLEEENRPK